MPVQAASCPRATMSAGVNAAEVSATTRSTVAPNPDVPNKNVGGSIDNSATAPDTAAERLIRQHIEDGRPDDGILGEEGGSATGHSGVRWIVDPIDGTVNYLYGIPAYAVSIAAECDGEVTVGVVHNPASGETWTALRGQGAWLGNRPLQVGGLDDPAYALVATGFNYDVRTRTRQAGQVARLLPLVRDIRRIGSA